MLEREFSVKNGVSKSWIKSSQWVKLMWGQISDIKTQIKVSFEFRTYKLLLREFVTIVRSVVLFLGETKVCRRGKALEFFSHCIYAIANFVLYMG